MYEAYEKGKGGIQGKWVFLCHVKYQFCLYGASISISFGIVLRAKCRAAVYCVVWQTVSNKVYFYHHNSLGKWIPDCTLDQERPQVSMSIGKLILSLNVIWKFWGYSHSYCFVQWLLKPDQCCKHWDTSLIIVKPCFYIPRYYVFLTFVLFSYTLILSSFFLPLTVTHGKPLPYFVLLNY